MKLTFWRIEIYNKQTKQGMEMRCWICFTRNRQQIGVRTTGIPWCLTRWSGKAMFCERGIGMRAARQGSGWESLALWRRHWNESCQARIWVDRGWLEETEGRDNCMGTEAWCVWRKKFIYFDLIMFKEKIARNMMPSVYKWYKRIHCLHAKWLQLWFLCAWDSPGKDTRVFYHVLL